MSQTRCKECGRLFESGTGCRYDSSFCCDGCYEKYKAREAARIEKWKEEKAKKKEEKKNQAAERAIAKEEKANKKEEKKKQALENAKVTSSESLSKVSHLCLTLGYLGVHRFAVGKFVSGLIMPVLLISGIIAAFTNNLSMLALSAVDIAWWLLDFAKIKAKKFTDKFGNTIREN